MIEKAVYLLCGVCLGAAVGWFLHAPNTPDSPRLEQLVRDSTTYVHQMDSMVQKKALVERMYKLRQDSLDLLLDQANAIRRSRPHQPHSSNVDSVLARLKRAVGADAH